MSQTTETLQEKKLRIGENLRTMARKISSAHYNIVMNGRFESKEKLLRMSQAFVWDMQEFERFFTKELAPIVKSHFSKEE